MSRAIRNMVVAFSQHVLGAFSGALGIFFISRKLPNAEHHLGILGFALSFVGFFVALQRTFDSAHVKRLSEGKPTPECNTTYLLLKILATTVLAGIVLAAILVWTQVLGRGFQSDLHTSLIGIVIVYHALNAIGEFMRETFRGQGNILYGQISLAVEHFVKGAATIYVAFYGLEPFVSGARNAFGLGIAYLTGASALALVALILVARQPFGKPSKKLVKSYMTFSMPLLATNVLFTTNDEVAQILLQLFWNARQVGIFFAPWRYIKFLPSVAQALGTALFPVLSSMHGQGETAPEVVQDAIRGVSLVLLPAVAVTVALPEAIVHVLLSDRFLASAPVLAALGIGGYLKSLRMTLEMKLRAVNKPQEVLKAGVAASVTNAILVTALVAPSLFGIPLAGLKATGAAIGITVSFLAGFYWSLKAARRHADVTFPPIWKHAVMFAATVAVLWGYTQVIPQTSFRIYHLMAGGLISLAVFVATGIGLGELTKRDWEMVERVVKPGRWMEFFAGHGEDDD